MRYLDVCAGISASTVAWKPLGWEAAAYSEIEAAPSAILAHHYPDTPLHGDFTTIRGDEYGPIDLLVGGTPCQDFSVAGLRAGLAGDRGNLSLQFLLLLARTRARWVVWENVPGVFSSLSHDAPDACPPAIDLDGDDGPEDGEEIVVEDEYDADESHALGCFLAGLSELGYGVAYRVLDAQFAGVPQRRRRIFVVGYLGDWRRAAAVLLERHGLQGHPAPRREARSVVAALTSAGVGTCGADDNQGQAGHLIAFGGGNTSGSIDVATAQTAQTAHGVRLDFDTETFIAHSLRGEGFDASEDGTGRGTPLVPVCFSAKDHGADAAEDLAPTLRSGGFTSSHANAGIMPAIAFAQNQRDEVRTMDVAGALAAEPGMKQQTFVAAPAVRRLTPRECERLQGFPDDYTLVPYRKGMMADGPRYKALGNSMAVPVMRWIGERIAMVDALQLKDIAA